MEGLASQDSRIRICTFAILHTNEMCCCLLIDARSMMCKTPLFRQQVKMNLNSADLQREMYESEIARTISKENSEYFADTNDRMDEEVGNLEKIFYYSIKQELDNAGMEYSDAVAKLIECEIFLRASLVSHDEAMSILSECGIGSLRKDYLKLTNMSFYVSRALKSIPHTKSIDLDTPRVTSAYNAFLNKFFDARIIEKTIEND